MEKPILVDVDGVLANFVGAVLDFINEKHGTILTPDDIHDDLNKSIPQYYDNDLIKFITSKGFCQTLQVLPGAKEAIDKFKSNNFKIIFVTSPYLNAPTWTYDRLKWLKKHFGAKRDDVIFARNKKYIDGLTLIDDLPRNCIEWHNYQNSLIGATLFSRPWNKKYHKNLYSIEITYGWKDTYRSVIDRYKLYYT